MFSHEIGPVFPTARMRTGRETVTRAISGDAGPVLFAAAAAAATGCALTGMQRSDGTFRHDDLLWILVGTGATT